MEILTPRHSENFTRKTKEVITVPLHYLKSDEEMEMLGMYLSPDGNNHDQVKYMKKNHSTRKPPYDPAANKIMEHAMPSN